VFAAEDKPERVVQKKALEAVEATKKEDFGKLADLAYPPLIEAAGGRAKLIAQHEAGVREMKARGFAIRSVKVGETAQVAADGDKRFAVVPFLMEMIAPEGILQVSSFLLGISPDKGKTWTFVDGVKANDEKVKKLLPKLPASLKLPPKKLPLLKKEK
jgi:hypothetical protein